MKRLDEVSRNELLDFKLDLKFQNQKYLKNENLNFPNFEN